MLLSHKPLPTPTPVITLGDVELTPQPQIKCLGVFLDPKLRFTDHVNTQVAKGVSAAHRLASLARTGWGIPLKKCLQLTSSLVHSRADYASVVWHRFGKTTGAPSKLQSVDHIAWRFALGVFKTHPTPFLGYETCSAPAHARLDAKTDTAIIRLLSLPSTNPAAALVKAVFSRNRRAHGSSIHHALGHPDSICRSMPLLPKF